jgi:hypothetical protein
LLTLLWNYVALFGYPKKAKTWLYLVDATLRERVAAKNSGCGKNRPGNYAALLHLTKPICTAAWVIPANITIKRRNQLSIQLQKSDN